MNFFLNTTSSVPTFIKNEKLEYVDITDSYAKLFDIDRKEFIGKTDREIFGTDIAKLYEQDDKLVLKKKYTTATLPGYKMNQPDTTFNCQSIKHLKTDEDNNKYIVGCFKLLSVKSLAITRYNTQIEHYSSLPNNVWSFSLIDITEWKLILTKYKNQNGVKTLFQNTEVNNLKNLFLNSIHIKEDKQNIMHFFNKQELMNLYLSGLSGEKQNAIISYEDTSNILLLIESFFAVNPDTEHLMLFLIANDITTDFSETEYIKKATELDAMTGLFNHKYVFKAMDDYLSLTGRKLTHAMLKIQINDLKYINEIFGQNEGDKIIISVANTLNDMLAFKGIYGRINGSQFIVLLKNVSSEEQTKKIIANLLDNLTYELDNGEETYTVTVSIGVTFFYGTDAVAEKIFTDTDKALTEAKSVPGASYHVYNKEVDSNINLRPNTYNSISENYSSVIEIYNNLRDSAVAAYHINLSQNSFIDCKLGGYSFASPPRYITAEDFFTNINSIIVNKCTELQFTLPFFLNAARNGETNITTELNLLLKITGFEMHHKLKVTFSRNPNTADYEAFIYFKNNHLEYLSSIISNKIMHSNYEMVAFIDIETECVSLINGSNSNIACNTTYWIPYETALKKYVDKFDIENKEKTMFFLNFQTVIKQLVSNPTYSVPVNIYDKALNVTHKIITFAFVDNSRKTLYFTLEDITHQYQAEYNHITGLLNEHAFYTKTRELIDSQPEKDFILLRWDIDNFKLFNFIFGAESGNEILASIGNVIKELSSNTTIVGNLGGDVFTICLEKKKFNEQNMVAYVTDLLESLTQDYYFTFRMAAYDIKERHEDISLMCYRALLAAKSIKSSVDKRFIWFDETLHKKYYSEQLRLQELRRCLNDSPDSFIFYIQPQYDINKNKVISGEVLVRWVHPENGLVMPNSFIQSLEKTRLITKLDIIIWEKTCQYLRDRINNNLPVVPLSINISRYDFLAIDVFEHMTNLVEKYDLNPKYINLEITESAYTNEAQTIYSTLLKLKNYGFLVEMDDFGSGYSSLNILRNVPVDVIKLDMRFFTSENGTNSHESNKGKIIVSSILRMLRKLNLEIIAEGIENAKQTEFIKKYGCHIVQGYYKSKPLSIDEFEKLL